MDSQRFLKILTETTESLNLILYTLNSYAWEVEKCHTMWSETSSYKVLMKENQKLKREIEEIRKTT